jgi:hypothetical protein
MNYECDENRSTLDAFAGAFSETLWETLIVVGVAAAICISLIGLSAQLNEAKAHRQPGAIHTAEVSPAK